MEDYHAFGKPVLAPADGTVVEARDNIPDFPHPGTGWIDWRTRDARGNYVVIRHSERVYSLIAHLRQGSCRVRQGDLVQRGQVIGECGNSGHSTEPHIHFQLQNHPNFYLAIGLPILFKHFEMQDIDSGKLRRYALGYISRGKKVANIPDDQNVAQHDKEITEVMSATVNLWDLISNLVLCILTISGVFAIFMRLVDVIQSILQLALGI
ncbi:MAG: M23 family metallopeptidase [Ardenticatenia bacterium]|nr:M23 family metallopeptidase [Ardenticatenia bacterium]